MPILNCYVDDETMRWLEKASADLGQVLTRLAEIAIENAAIEYKVECMKRSPQEVASE